MDYFLTSARLGFRTWQPEDRELAIGLWGDPGVTRFVFAKSPTAAEIEERLAREIAMQLEHGFQYWPIFLREDGAHVGCCGLRPYRPSIPELGVHLRPEFWRRGLASEAARAVIEHAFTTIGATAIFAGHNPNNSSSRAMLLALGFRYTHDELYPPTGLEHPCYLRQR
jgi:[ribosomal protein S5]-alanine N-acetyltransferase